MWINQRLAILVGLLWIASCSSAAMPTEESWMETFDIDSDGPLPWGWIDWVSDQNGDGACDLLAFHAMTGRLQCLDGLNLDRLWGADLRDQGFKQDPQIWSYQFLGPTGKAGEFSWLEMGPDWVRGCRYQRVGDSGVATRQPRVEIPSVGSNSMLRAWLQAWVGGFETQVAGYKDGTLSSGKLDPSGRVRKPVSLEDANAKEATAMDLVRTGSESGFDSLIALVRDWQGQLEWVGVGNELSRLNPIAAQDMGVVNCFSLSGSPDGIIVLGGRRLGNETDKSGLVSWGTLRWDAQSRLSYAHGGRAWVKDWPVDLLWVEGKHGAVAVAVLDDDVNGGRVVGLDITTGNRLWSLDGDHAESSSRTKVTTPEDPTESRSRSLLGTDYGATLIEHRCEMETCAAQSRALIGEGAHHVNGDSVFFSAPAMDLVDLSNGVAHGVLDLDLVVTEASGLE